MQELSAEERKILNDLARESLMLKILAEVNFDMNVCRLEGWDYRELPLKIKKEMDGIIHRLILGDLVPVCEQCLRFYHRFS